MEENKEVSKKPWESKSIIVAFVGLVAQAAALFWPHASVVNEWLAANAALVGSVWSILAMGLRLVSKDKIALRD